MKYHTETKDKMARKNFKKQSYHKKSKDFKLANMAMFSQDARDHRVLSTRPKMMDRISNKSQFNRVKTSSNDGDELLDLSVGSFDKEIYFAEQQLDDMQIQVNDALQSLQKEKYAAPDHRPSDHTSDT